MDDDNSNKSNAPLPQQSNSNPQSPIKAHDLNQIHSNANSTFSSSGFKKTSQDIVVSHYEKKQPDNYYNNFYDSGAKAKKAVFGISKWIFDSVQVIVIALAVFVIFYLFVVSPHTIDGVSMQPNFCNGDIILADKITPRFSPYKVGDVIVFKHDIANDYIKRIVGLPGDLMKIEDGKVYRNGLLLDESYLSLPPGEETTEMSPNGMEEGRTYEVPEGTLWVFGDNRPKSTDSRTFFQIDPNGENPIKGRVKLVIWPLHSARIFDQNEAREWNYCETN